MQHSDEDGAAFASDSTNDYRQGRSAASATAAAPANSIARSMSRYRKRANSTARAAAQEVATTPQQRRHEDSQNRSRSGSGETPITPVLLPSSAHATPVPPVPTIPLQHATLAQAGFDATRARHAAGDATPALSTPTAAASNRPPPPRLSERQPLGPNAPTATSSRQVSGELESRSRSESRDHPVRRMRTNSDEDNSRQQLYEQAFRSTEPIVPVTKTPERIVTRSRKESVPAHIPTQPILVPSPQLQKSDRSPVQEKLAIMGKVRKANPDTSHAPKPAREEKTPESHSHVGIVSGGRGIVPQTDAPTSAVNTADQIVTVRCRGNRFLLDVDADTTIDDIIAKCGRFVNDAEINTLNCVVLESFDSLGLERRVRRFEAIRDIVNSWDLDSANCLIVRIREPGDSMTDLDMASVAKSPEPPKGCQIYMYHSNKPGKWNKRHITLLDNGQIILSKKEDAYAGEKDTTNLCRLSDYDIYQPSEATMRKYLKPPKRHCFAIRSQQKTTVFLNTDNYVQYFSVEDPKQASLFQDRVQSWRSWYLLDRRPEPKKQTVTSPPRSQSRRKEDSQSSPAARHAKRQSVNLTNGHRVQVSVDETPYSIGEFKPLLDLSRFDKRLSQFGTEAPAPVVSESPRMSRDLSRPHRNSLVGGRLIDTIKADDGFTGNGLLAGDYEDRREVVSATVRKESGSDSAAFADGPTLLNKQASAPKNQPDSAAWFPSALEHTAKHGPVRAVTSSAPPTSRRQQPAQTTPPAPTGQNGQQQNLIGSARNRDQIPGSIHVQQQRTHESRGAMAQPSRQREQPKPLLDISSPSFNEAQQWRRRGHGVKAPEGIERLVDYISPSDPFGPAGRQGVAMLNPPASSSTRRPSPNPPSGSTNYPPPVSSSTSRARSQSFSNSSGNGRAMMAIARGMSSRVPPMPAQPDRTRDASSGREREHRERERLRRKQQERAYKEKEAAFNAVPGRNGTLKVV